MILFRWSVSWAIDYQHSELAAISWADPLLIKMLLLLQYKLAIMRSRFKTTQKTQNPLPILESNPVPAALHNFSPNANLSYDGYHPRRFRLSTETPLTPLSSSQIIRGPYSAQVPFKCDRVELYRNRMSLDFKAFHAQEAKYEAMKQVKEKQVKGAVMDRFMIQKKAAVLTRHIYEQQLQRCKYQSRLVLRIKERVSLLKKINRQKHQLLRSYFLIEK